MLRGVTRARLRVPTSGDVRNTPLREREGERGGGGRERGRNGGRGGEREGGRGREREGEGWRESAYVRKKECVEKSVYA